MYLPHHKRASVYLTRGNCEAKVDREEGQEGVLGEVGKRLKVLTHNETHLNLLLLLSTQNGDAGNDARRLIERAAWGSDEVGRGGQ